MGPLRGVSVKLDRAQHHLDCIDSAVREYAEVELPNAVREAASQGQVDLLNRGWQTIRWRGDPSADPMLGAVLGDFVHNVRSALDQLIWILVLANGGSPGDRHTHFPAAESEKKWRADITERNVQERGPAPTHGLSDDALKLVFEAQPFRLARKARVRAPLRLLLTLSNEDKHRMLYAAASFPTGAVREIRYDPPGYVLIHTVRYPQQPAPIKDGAELADVKVSMIRPPGQTEMHLSFTLPVNVAFFSGGSGKFAVSFDELGPMLDDARQVTGAASRLPEIS